MKNSTTADNGRYDVRFEFPTFSSSNVKGSRDNKVVHPQFPILVERLMRIASVGRVQAVSNRLCVSAFAAPWAVTFRPSRAENLASTKLKVCIIQPAAQCCSSRLCLAYITLYCAAEYLRDTPNPRVSDNYIYKIPRSRKTWRWTQNSKKYSEYLKYIYTVYNREK